MKLAVLHQIVKMEGIVTCWEPNVGGNDPLKYSMFRKIGRAECNYPSLLVSKIVKTMFSMTNSIMNQLKCNHYIEINKAKI